MNKGNQPLYIEIYERYKSMIISGRLVKGTKLPSIRRACNELGVSKTTVEAAYFQLEAEGYITSKPQSGFFVADINPFSFEQKKAPTLIHKARDNNIEFDFASASVDREVFDFNLWQRYIKSALRDNIRLLSYGEPQGEADLRCALADYVSSRRGVVCSPDQIVVGAGVQSLLQILCSIDEKHSTVAFAGIPFARGCAVFNAFGRNIANVDYSQLNSSNYTLKGIDYVYTNPSHINPWGDILPISQRLELIRLSKEKEFIVIEDDYNSEFQYFNRPVPSLQGLDSSDNTLYIGTFSKLLLPSLRISFMVLPVKLLKLYQKNGLIFNQTASKTEQIALSRYLRDGNLSRQIKKARRLYADKCKALCEKINEYGAHRIRAIMGTSGILFRIEVNSTLSSEELAGHAADNGIALRALKKTDDKSPCLLLSCSSLPSDRIEDAAKKLVQVLNEKAI